MKILIISDSFIIKEAISSLFINNFKTSKVKSIESINDIGLESLNTYDIIFMEISIKTLEDLEKVIELKQLNSNLKIVVLDHSKNEIVCTKAIKVGIDGYITNLESEEDFVYIIKKIISGNKFYDGQTIQKALSKNFDKTHINLTNREKEAMIEVSKGSSNREIAKALNITEYTVKKHISSILDKLNLKNRQDIIIYVKDKNIHS
ncbi:response regulator transcription factor [Romboutsia sp.]|uniref:response regulator transcription factor n=1 Tax=Romboutsia sp. TaxID=1965302 RepID=UPI003F2B1249